MSARRIVVLGMMARMPVAGVVWQTAHYLLGFEMLGYETYYVEANGTTPKDFFVAPDDDGWKRAASFVERVMRRFGMSGRWAYDARFAGNRCFGMSRSELNALYASADAIINLHGGTEPFEEVTDTGRLVYLETDPVEVQVELAEGNAYATQFLGAHQAFFTFGENLGRPDCGLPVSSRFQFRPTRQPVVLDLWDIAPPAGAVRFTTIGNWEQRHRGVQLHGETYGWSKHEEFMKVLGLPQRTGKHFELALSSYSDDDVVLLEHHGWRVRPALPWSRDLDSYRSYIAGSSAEFTVAKDQNVRLRSGWFSDRSATYLAAGRAVVTQDTGFSNVLPVGEGLFSFGDADDAAAAVDTVASDPRRHGIAARQVAREWFASEVVLGELLSHLGLPVGPRRPLDRVPLPVPNHLAVQPIRRWPTRLRPETVEHVQGRPWPNDWPLGVATGRADQPTVSVVVVTFGNLAVSRLCLESLLLTTDGFPIEIIVVDNASPDETPAYLTELTAARPDVTVLLNEANRGFAAANNQGIARSTGDVLVLLNNDTIVTPGWLQRLVERVADANVGLVGPVTNHTCNEAEVEAPYTTYEELLDFAGERRESEHGHELDLPMLAMFCIAMRRSVFEDIGPLDDGYELGMFEDDDYAARVRAAGLRVLCIDDAFVHHVGQASLGDLPNARYDEIFRANQARFERRWGPWNPHGRRHSAHYEALRDRVRAVLEAAVPVGSTVLVASKGDEHLVTLRDRRGWHFPRLGDGSLAAYPADSEAAIAHLADLVRMGASHLAVPATSAWWLEHYAAFAAHIGAHHRLVHEDEDVKVFALDNQPSDVPA